MPYGPAVLGIPAKEKAAREYGTAGVNEELARASRANTENTQDPLQQQRRGERSRVKAPTNPGEMTTPTPDPRTRNPDQVDAYAAARYNRPGTDIVPRGGGPGMKSLAVPNPDLPILDGPVTPITTGNARLDELNRIQAARGKTGVQSYAEDVAGTVREDIRAGGSAFEAIAKGEDVGPNLLKAGGAALGLLGIPFLYAGGEVVQTGIEANPLMRDRFHEMLAKYGISPDDNSQPSVRIAIADLVIEEFENAAHDAASDPLQPDDVKVSAAVISGLLKAEQFAILGGPQGAAALARLGPAILARARGTKAPALTLEQLTARSGGKTSTAASRTITDTSPEATAAAQEIARMVKERSDALLVGDAKAAAKAEEGITAATEQKTADALEANRLRLEAINGPQAEFHAATAKVQGGTVLGPALQQAITSADREVSRLAAKGAGQGIDLVQLDKIIDGLDAAAARASQVVPDVVMKPLRDLRATLYDQTTKAETARSGALAMYGEGKVEGGKVVMTKKGDVASRLASQAATAEAQATRGQFDAASRMARAQNRLEQAAGSLGRAQEEAQVVATRRLAAKAKGVGADITAGEGAVADAGKAGKAAEQAITDAADAAKVNIVETGDQFRTDIQNRANKLVTQLAARADRIRASVSSERMAVRMKGPKDEPLLGYMAPDDAAAWEQGRIHTGKQDDPFTRSAMAQFFRGHGDEIEEALKHVTWKQMLMGISEDLGIDWKQLAKKLPETLEVTRRMYIAQKVLGLMTRDWQRAASEVTEGRMTPAEFDLITGNLITFTKSVSEGISELGRALGAQRLIKRTAAAELVQVSVEVKRRRSTLDAASSKLEDIAAESAKALEEAAKAGGRSDVLTATMVTAVEDSRAAAQKLSKATTAAERNIAQMELDQIEAQLKGLQEQRAQIQNASSERVRAAQLRMEQQIQDVDAARGDYDRAVQKAADAAKEAHDIYVQRAIRLGATPEQMRVLAQLEPENVQGILHFMRDLVPQGRGAGLFTYAMNNMYGGIPSQVNNTLNTGLHVLTQNLIVRPAMEAVGPIVNKAVGAPVIVRGETKAAWMAMYSATPDAARLWMRTILQGEAPEIALKYGMVGLTEESGAKFGIGQRPTVAGLKGIPLEGWLRNLGGSDGFWRISDTAGEARALQMVDAFRAGKDGEALNNLTEFTTRPTLEQLTRASRVSLANTFNDAAEVGTWTQRTLHLLNKDYAGFAPLRVLVPAARFGISSAKHSVSLMGGGIVGGALKIREARGLEGAEQIAKGREGARQFIEGSIGAMLLIVANNAYDSGLVTGSYPSRKQDQEKWALEGRQEMSIKIGGVWVPMSFFGPLSAPFAITSLIRDQTGLDDTATVGDRVERAAMGVGRFITDVPAFSGMYRLMDTIYSGAKYGASVATEKFLSLQIGKFIWQSSTLRSLVPVWDPYERDPEGIIERLSARVPIFSGGVPPAITPEGDLKQRPVAGPGALLPFAGPAPLDLGARDQALAESGQTLMPIGNKIGGVTLERDQFRRYQEVAGPLSTKALDKLITTDEYKNETDPATRQKMREREIDKARVEARKTVAREFLDAAKTEAAVLSAATMYRSQYTTNRDRAYMVLELRNDGRLTDVVQNELDRTRGGVGADRDPTVEQMLHAAPLVKQYLAIAPYRQGDQAEWQRLKEARAEEADIRKDDPKKADAFHRDSALLRKYDNTALVNPERARFRALHPEIASYISGSGYIHEP